VRRERVVKMGDEDKLEMALLLSLDLLDGVLDEVAASWESGMRSEPVIVWKTPRAATRRELLECRSAG
jgi:hypothetical protein